MASQPSHRRAARGTLFLVVRLVAALALALMTLPTANISAFADDASTDPVVSAEPGAEDPAAPGEEEAADPAPAEVVEEEAPPAAEGAAPTSTTTVPEAATRTQTRQTTAKSSTDLVEPTVLVTAAFTGTDLLAADYIRNDENGANDEPGQKDLTRFFGFSAAAGTVKIGWNWDEIAWSGNNTGDACALFDTDSNGKADYAVCVTVSGSPATQLDVADNPSPRLYSCNDSRVDRCAGPTLIASGGASSVDCEVSQTDTDPFLAGDAYEQDTSALCTIPLSLFTGGGAPKLINVCSFPSQEPNSDPSDCVLIPRDALLTVVKVVTPSGAADSTLFGFTFTGASAPQPFSLLAGGSEVIPVRSGSDLSLAEDAATGWTLLSATCTNGQSPSALKLDSEQSVTCTFTNTRNASVTVNKSWVINGTSYTNADKPAGYSATLTLTGQDSPAFGSTYGGYSYGASVTVGETVSVPDGCTNIASGGGLGTKTLAGGNNVYSVINTVTCPATVQVNKSWVINGTSYTNADKPAGYSATLTLTGQTDPTFGTTYAGYVQGQNVTVAEDVTVPPGCTNVASGGGLGAHTLAKGPNVYSVTNTVTCGASVTVNKSWVINGTSYTNASKPAGYSATLTLTGQTDPTFGTTYAGYVQGQDVTVGEDVTVPPGCTNVASGGGLGAHTLAKGPNVYSVINTVTCPATVQVVKSWVINGTPYTNGEKPAGYSATLTLTGQNNPAFGATYEGYVQGQDVTIGENVTVPEGCVNTPSGDTGAHQLAKGANVFTITNTVTCDSSVRVDKTWVINGTTYNQGDTVPAGYTATLFVTGQVNPTFGTTYDDYTQGDTVTISELANVPEGCTNTPSGDTGAHTLAKGANVYTITNTVRCAATVTVNKTWVINGVTYNQGDTIPAGYTATLSLTKKQAPEFGQTYTGYIQGESITIGETAVVPDGCANDATGTGNKTLAKGPNVYTITNTVTCDSSVRVDKTWVINGVTYQQGDTVPAGYTATLSLTDQVNPTFGTTYDDYTQGDTVTISELANVPEGCTNVPSGDIGTRTLAKGVNVYTITNTVTCAATVQVIKSWVVNGTTYTNANRPSFVSASLGLTGQTNPAFGTTYAGYTQGNSVTISESVTVPGDCSNVASGTGTRVLERGANVFTVTNTVTCPPAWELSKSSNPASGSTVTPGETITYTLHAANTSHGVVAGATATDNLGDVLDNATLAEPLASGLSITGTTLTWAVPTMAPGGSASVSYTVRVSEGEWDQTLRNVVTPNGSGGSCDEPDDCTTDHFTPAWSLVKSSAPPAGSTVEPGDPVTYTLTATNTSLAMVEGATAYDDLSDVLDDATIDEATLAAGLALSGTTLTWAIPTLAPGQVATVSYTVTVAEDAWDQTLRNVVSPQGLGGECEEPGDCTTEHFTPGWELTKVSDPASGSEVDAGDDITYTLTAVNTSDAVVEGATAVDDLSEVLDHATLDEASLPDELTFSGTTLTWAIPTLAPGEQASVSYTVTVDKDASDVILKNVVVPVGNGGICVEADDCTTTHDTPEILGEEVVKPRPPVVLGEELPPAGAPDSSTLVGLLGTLCLGLGALLMAADRRRRTQQRLS